MILNNLIRKYKNNNFKWEKQSNIFFTFPSIPLQGNDICCFY